MSDGNPTRRFQISIERVRYGIVEAELPPAPVTSVAIHLSGCSTLEWGAGSHRAIGRPKRGDVIIVPRGRAGSLRVYGDQSEVLKIGVSDAAIAAWAASEERSLERAPLIDRFTVADPLVLAIGLALLGEKECSGVRDTLYHDALSGALMAHLLRCHSEAALAPADASRVYPLSGPRARRALAFMEARMGDAITLRDIAHEVGVSPSHFGAQFRRSFGRTPARHLAWLRLDRARGMLEGGHQPVNEIANAVGFRSVSHFTHAFRAEFGQTPTAWRISRGR